MIGHLMRSYLKPSRNLADNRVALSLIIALPMVAIVAATMSGPFGIWIAASLLPILVASAPQRPSMFEAALPISGKDIALAQLLTALVMGIALIGTACVAIVVVKHETIPVMDLATSLALVTLLVVLPRLVRVREFSVPPTHALLPMFVTGFSAAGAIVFLDRAYSLTLLWGLALAALVFWWSKIPESFQAAPVLVARGDSPQSATRVSDLADTSRWWKLVVQSSTSKQRVFHYAMLIFGGAAGNWQLFLPIVFATDDTWNRMRWMQSMPFSHRHRLWMTLLPTVFAPIFFLVVGMQIHVPGNDFMQSLRRGAPSTYKQEPRYFDSPTSISLEHWERAKDGVVPMVRAPWGETVEPYVVHVLPGTYYNPYTARKASSERFTEWQFRRLTTAVYGYPLELKDHDALRVHPRRLTQSVRLMLLNIATGLTFAFILMLGLGITRWRGAWSHKRLATTVSFCTVFIPLLPFVSQMFLYSFQQGVMDLWIPLLQRQLMNLSAVLPDNLFLTALIAMTPVVAVYALLERQFSRSEMVDAVVPVQP